MKSFLIIFSFIGLFSCSDLPKQPSPTIDNTKTLYESSGIKYKKLIDDLKHDYVLYYKTVKSIGIDLTRYGMPETDSAFKIDSIKFWTNYRDFFNQDEDFITWLLSFKHDTTNIGLWVKYHNPISSYLSECNLPDLNNSRAAIILLENFLNGHGYGLECFECEFDNRQRCNFDKYAEIETFLLNNNDKNISELRTIWQKKKTVK